MNLYNLSSRSFKNMYQHLDQSLKDIISGFVSGWTQVIIMQPFEIVKIRLQTQSTQNPYYNGMVDCFKKIAKQQGLPSFYKGTVTPLIGIGFQASAMFFSYQWAKRSFKKLQKNPKQRLDIRVLPFAAIIASLPTSLVASPVEHARIRIQIQKEGGLYSGSVEAGRSIIKNYGIRGLYRGFFPTWGRQAVGQASYFTTYEVILRSFVRKDQKIAEAPIAASLLAGGCAGVVFWLFAYPCDYVKTLMQTDELQASKQQYKSMRDCFARRFKDGGMGTFYKGIGVTLWRAALVNAGGFFAFESTLRFLGKDQNSD